MLRLFSEIVLLGDLVQYMVHNEEWLNSNDVIITFTLRILFYLIKCPFIKSWRQRCQISKIFSKPINWVSRRQEFVFRRTVA